MLVEEEALWPHLRLLARHLWKLALTGRSLERVLAQLLGVSVRCQDQEGLTKVLGLVPAEVSWDVLAYDLACHAAVTGDKPGLLRFTARSLELGKAPAQFEKDSDFAPYLEDAEFRTLLRTVE